MAQYLQHQLIISTSDDLFSKKFQGTDNYFISSKYIWNDCLQNDGHFPQVSMSSGVQH